MKNVTKIIIIITSILVTGCNSNPGDGLFGMNNPLHLYDGGFSIHNVFYIRYRFPDYSKPLYTNLMYNDNQGILENTNYILIVSNGNPIHIYRSGINTISNLQTNIMLSNYAFNDKLIICANEKYFISVSYSNDVSSFQVFLISNLQLVYERTNDFDPYLGSLLFGIPEKISQCQSHIILGNGKSDLLAYVYSLYHIRLINLSNTNIIEIGEGFSVCAFSPFNKYLFYTDFGEKSKYYFWDDYINNYRKYNGQPFIYDIQKKTNYSIATYNCLDTGIGFNNGDYGTTTAMGLKDGFYAIDYSLTNLYIYICDPDYSFHYDHNLYDGTYAPDAEGLYRIDISSLGLSE